MSQDSPASASPSHLPGSSAGGFPPAQLSDPVRPSIADASPDSPPVPSAAEPSERWGPAGLEETIGWAGVSAAMEAVHWDLDKVLDGRRFGGFGKDDSGRSITVYVVRGPHAAEAESIARGCARSDIPINIGYVDRSYDQLRGLGASLSRTLPAEVKTLLYPEGAVDAMGGYQWAIDVRRNRLCLFATASPTPAMRHALLARYGDAVELWVQSTHTLIAPDRSWTTS